MLKCNEVSRLLASGEAEGLDRWKKLQLRMHLLMCNHCRRYAAQLKNLGRMARKVWGPGAEDRTLLRQLENDIVREGFPRSDQGS